MSVTGEDFIVLLALAGTPFANCQWCVYTAGIVLSQSYVCLCVQAGVGRYHQAHLGAWSGSVNLPLQK